MDYRGIYMDVSVEITLNVIVPDPPREVARKRIFPPLTSTTYVADAPEIFGDPALGEPKKEGICNDPYSENSANSGDPP